MKVSFYILAYNHQEFIEDAVNAALKQTYQSLEIIVSDDHSTDNTWQIIQECLGNYSGPHKIVARRNSQNVGISRHINEVFRHCNGDWIVASAGDDMSVPDRVSRIMEAVAKDPKIKLVQSWLEEVDHAGVPLKVNMLASDCALGQVRKYGLEERIQGVSYHPHGAAMAYSRDIIDSFDPLPNGVIFEDNIVNLRAELLGSAAVLAQPLVKHRNHAGQITRTAGAANESKVRERIRLRLESDILSSQQNLADIAAVSNKLPPQQLRGIAQCYRKRHSYFINKGKALLYVWPIRLVYLFYLFLYPNIAPLSSGDLRRSMIPGPLYRLLKRRRSCGASQQ